MAALQVGSQERFREDEVGVRDCNQARMGGASSWCRRRRTPGVEPHAMATATCRIGTGLSRKEIHVHELSRIGTG